jgi:FMN phosphatase YigB (HAD superfamily)
MIKYLIFDWGGVCTHGHLLRDFSDNLAIRTGMKKEEIESVFRESEYPYETGNVSPEKFWDDFKEKLGLTIELGEIKSVFLNSYVLNQEVLDYILELKKRYEIVLFTNNYEDLFSFIKKNYNLEKYFDFMFSSSDIKHKKPEAEAYEF